MFFSVSDIVFVECCTIIFVYWITWGNINDDVKSSKLVGVSYMNLDSCMCPILHLELKLSVVD